MVNKEIEKEKKEFEKVKEEKPAIVLEVEKKEEELFKTEPRIENITGLIKDESSAPTHTPRNFREQIYTYLSGTTYRLYWYIKDAWKKVYDSSGIGFTSKARAYRGTSVQSIANNTLTKVELNAESYDVDSEFDSTTNYRFTATSAGYYLVCASCRLDAGVDGKYLLTLITKNGNVVAYTQMHMSSTSGAGIGVSDILYLASGNYVELYVKHDSGVASNLSYGLEKTFMSIHRLS